MAAIVLDTSVALKWFLADEPDRPQALALREAIVNHAVEPIVPSHMPLELAAGLVAAVRRGRLTADRLEPALDAFGQFAIPSLDAASIVERSAGLALSLGVSVYDASFIVAASVARAPLVTADRTLKEKAAAAGHDVIALSDFPARIG